MKDKGLFSEPNGKKSSNRHIFMVGMVWAMLISTVYLFRTWDATNFVLIFTAISTIFVGLKLGQKPMEQKFEQKNEKKEEKIE